MKSHWPISVLSTFASAANMLMPLVLVRVLPPDQIGIFKIFFLYVTLVPSIFFVSGLVSGIAYWGGRAEPGKQALKASGLILLGMGAVAALATWLGRHVLGGWLGWSDSVAAAFAVSMLGSVAAQFFEEVAISTGRIWTGAIFSSALEVSRAALIIAAAYKVGSIEAIFWTHAALITFKVLLGFTLAYKFGIFNAKGARTISWEVLKYAMPVSTAWIFGVFANYADQILLSKLVAPADFAIYSIGCLSIPPILILEYSVTRVLVPDLSKAFSNGRLDEAAALFKNAVIELGYFIVPAAVGLSVFARPIVHMLFTERYSGGADYLKIFAFTYLFAIIPYDVVQRARGESIWILKNFSVFSVLTTLICALFLKLFGPVGAIYGMIVAKLAMRVQSLWHVSRLNGWALTDFLPLRELAAFSTIALCLGGVSHLVRGFFDSEFVWFGASAAFYSVCYLPLAFLFRRLKPVIAEAAHAG